MTSLYFYHLLPKGSNIPFGITSLLYQYQHSPDQFLKNAEKYKERLVHSWNIYPGRSPKDLMPEEILFGLNQFRKSKTGANQIYFFKFPPFEDLGPKMKKVLQYKDIYQVDIFSSRTRPYIKKIFFGFENSFTGGKPLNLKYYKTITHEEYYKNYTEKIPMIFSRLNHIAIEPLNGFLPRDCLELIETPITFSDACNYL